MKKSDREREFLAAVLAAAMLNNESKQTPETDMDVRKGAKELGDVMMQAMLGFMDAGFSEERAFEIMLTVKEGK